MGIFTRLFGYTVVTQVITKKLEDCTESNTCFTSLERAVGFASKELREIRSFEDIVHVEIYRNRDWEKLFHTYK